MEEIAPLPKNGDKIPVKKRAALTAFNVVYAGHIRTRREEAAENYTLELWTKDELPEELPKKKKPAGKKKQKPAGKKKQKKKPADDSSEGSETGEDVRAMFDSDGEEDERSASAYVNLLKSRPKRKGKVKKRKPGKRKAAAAEENDDTLEGKKERLAMLHKRQRVSTRRRRQDMVDKAVGGNTSELLQYLREHIDDVIATPKMGPTEWANALPSWYGRGKERGLKVWKSSTARSQWTAGCLCAKAVNVAINVYMKVIAVPPVCEGETTAVGLVFKDGGLDLYSTFLHTVHVAYCKYLNPAVEAGFQAYQLVLQYLASRTIKVKLLRAVRHIFTIPFQNTHSRHPFKTQNHDTQDTQSRHTLKTYFHDTLSRHTITAHSQDTQSRHTLKTYFHDTL